MKRNIPVNLPCLKFQDSSRRMKSIDRGLYFQGLFVLAVLFLLTLQFCTSAKPKQAENGQIPIIEVTNGDDPEIIVTDHHHHDVVVYRLRFEPGDSLMGKPLRQVYSFRYFILENDTLRGYKAWFATDDSYDRNEFSWLNDTTVSMRLYHTKTNLAHTLKLFGRDGSSGIIEE